MSADAPEAGDVWHLEGKIFPNDKSRAKFFVVLNTPTVDENFVCAFVTSEGKRYFNETSAQCSCPSLSCFRIDIGQETCFPKQTWVQFDNVRELSRASWVTLVGTSQLRFVQS